MTVQRNLAELCRERGLDGPGLAQAAGLEPARVRAILEGRWTPSPQERERIAKVLGLDRSAIAWGHVAPVEHLHGHGPQFGRTP
jgi:transcriptional regulator with XRE-family HTH domain